MQDVLLAVINVLPRTLILRIVLAVLSTIKPSERSLAFVRRWASWLILIALITKVTDRWMSC